MTRRILITGGTGQVGTELARLNWPRDISLEFPTRTALDLSKPASIAPFISAGPWAAVINAAAYTAVDKAETATIEAWTVNALAPAILAHETNKLSIPLVHVSTDYVFDGLKKSAYVEEDTVGPINVYGASKEGGEQGVRTGNPRYAIVRTAWIVSAHGANFVKTMLRVGAERPALGVVDDQRGCPTGAADLAAALSRIALCMMESPDHPIGTYHFVNAGETTWCGLARHVFEVAARLGKRVPRVDPINTDEYPTPARRPSNSRLSAERISADFGIRARPWQDAVAEIVEALVLNDPTRRCHGVSEQS